MSGPLRSMIPSPTCLLPYYPKCSPADLKRYRRTQRGSYESTGRDSEALLTYSDSDTGRGILPPGVTSPPFYFPAGGSRRSYSSLPTPHQQRQTAYSVLPLVFFFHLFSIESSYLKHFTRKPVCGNPAQVNHSVYGLFSSKIL